MIFAPFPNIPMKNPLICLSFCLLAGSVGAEIPKTIPHQGRIVVGGVNYDGTGQFKFLLFADPDADHSSGNETALWSNAATSPSGLSEPASAIAIPVAKGLYGTWLGDASIVNMATLPASIEPPAGSRLYLRIWFSNGVAGFQALSPDQTIAAVPFALHAAGVSEGAVTAASLADGAITSAKLADGAVTQTKLATGAVTSATLADDAVTGEKIAVGAVTGIGVPSAVGSIQPGGTIISFTRQLDNVIFGNSSVVVSPPFVYATNPETNALWSFDVSNPLSTQQITFTQANLDEPTALAHQGNFLYVVDAALDRLQIFNANPFNIVARDFDQTNLSDPTAVAVQGNFAYVLDKATDRLQIFDVSDPNSIVARDFDQTNMASPKAVVVRDSHAYVVDESTNRLQIFDISNPHNIVPAGSISTGASPKDLALAGNFAYVVTTGGALRIFDISNPLGIVAKDTDTTNLVSPSMVAASDDIVIVGDPGSNLLQTFNVSNPLNIRPIDTFSGGVGFIPKDLAVSGDFAYVTANSLRVFQFRAPTVNGGLGVNGPISTNSQIEAQSLFVRDSISGDSVFADQVTADTIDSGTLNSTSLNAQSLSATTVTANSFNLSSPKTYTLSIPGNALMPTNQSENLFRSQLGFIQLNSSADLAFSGVVPVNLPEGAVITGFDTLYYDNAAAADFVNLSVRVRRVLTTAATVAEQNIFSTELGATTSSNSAMIVSTNNTPDPTRTLVNNSLYTYFVSIGFNITAYDGSLRVYGFRIRYTLSSLTP